jgi:hypothetical protein
MNNKFSEQLEKVTRGVSRPIGFGQYGAQAKPRLFIMAEATVFSQGAGLPGIDALLVAAPCNCKSEKSNLLLGCALGGKTEHAGCDFVVLNLDGSVVGVDDDTSRLLRFSGELSDIQLRAMGSLDFSALIAEAGLGEDLIYLDLLVVQRLVDLTGKPLLLRIPMIYKRAELQALSDRGIAGFIVDGDKINTAILRTEVESLEPKKRAKEKATAIVNCPPPPAHAEEGEPEIEPDEDE